MTILELADRFYPLRLRLCQAKYLMNDVMDYGKLHLSDAKDQQRYDAYTVLLYDLLKTAVNEAESIQTILDGQ